MTFKIYDKITTEYVGTLFVELCDVRKYEKDFILIRK